MMTCDLMVVTYKKDFPYLRYFLRSLAKFATGFNACHLLVPHDDVHDAWKLIDDTGTRPFPVFVHGYAEPSGKGMLWHMRQILYADEWCGSEMIAHMDADCVFDAPITPHDFLDNGKIILRYEPFVSIGKRHDAVLRWQDCTQLCLPFPVLYESMRGHPEVYHRSTYELTRKLMEEKTGKKVDDYILLQENAYPQSWCEHCTIGNVAMEKQGHLYHPVLQLGDCPTPDNKVFQAWSHGPTNKPQDLWYKGKQASYVPEEMFEKILSASYYNPTAEEMERMAQ